MILTLLTAVPEWVYDWWFAGGVAVTLVVHTQDPWLTCTCDALNEPAGAGRFGVAVWLYVGLLLTGPLLIAMMTAYAIFDALVYLLSSRRDHSE